MKPTCLAIPALLLLIGSLRADDLPVNEGLWYVHTVTTTSPGDKRTEGVHRICRNHAFDQYSQAQAKRLAGSNCATVSDLTKGTQHTSELKCHIGRSLVDTRQGVTLLDQYHLHAETRVTYSPKIRGTSEQLTIEDDAYIGSCPLELKPGDEKLDDGSIRHLWKHDSQ